jgi:thioredoxin 1
MPVLVDFWAEWCGPCRMVGPILEQLAGEYAGKIKMGKVNVDDNRHIASKYGIRSIPTFIIFKEGQNIKQLVGALPADKIRQEIEAVL